MEADKISSQRVKIWIAEKEAALYEEAITTLELTRTMREFFSFKRKEYLNHAKYLKKSIHDVETLEK